MSRLHSGNSGESPARSAVTLVLNLLDCSFISPVNGDSLKSLVDLILEINVWGSLALWSGFLAKKFLVLSISPGGELVVSDGEGISLLSIDLVDLLVSLHELLESELEFFSCSIGVAPLMDVSDVLGSQQVQRLLLWSVRVVEADGSECFVKSLHFLFEIIFFSQNQLNI